MKLLKITLALLVALAALLLGGGLLLSPRFTVVRSAQIQAPPERVYALVADPRQWARWAVWNQRDPMMQIEYSGAPAGAGAVWAWRSASEGDGRMSFTIAEPGRRLGYELYFPDFGTSSSGELDLAPAGGGTRITWRMNGDMGRHPLWRWMALFADRMVGPDFEAGLANLRKLAEAGP